MDSETSDARMMPLYSPSADSNVVLPPVPLVYDDGVSTTSIQRVLFVNSGAVPLETYANVTTFPIVYDSSSALEDILEVMRRKFPGGADLTRIGFAFHNHGDLTRFCNREEWFTDSDLEEGQTAFSPNAQFMFDFLREFKVTHVDFLACNTLQSEKWRKYFGLIQTQTGVIVGASDDDTGNVKYGGDWVLESTMEDVRDVYFTTAIESYASLLASALTIVTNPGKYCDSLTILGDYMYTFAVSKILKIDLRTNTVTDFYNQGNTTLIRAMCAYGDFLYFHSGNNSIGKLNLSDGSIVSLNWITGLDYPWGIVTDGTYLYITNYIAGGYIVRVPLATGGVAPAAWITGLSYPWRLCIYGSHLYLNGSDSRIRKYNLSDGSLVTANLTGSAGAVSGVSIWAHNSYLYVSMVRFDNVSHGITQVSMDGKLVNPSFFVRSETLMTADYSYYTHANDMAVYNNKLYCASYDYGYVFSVGGLPVPNVVAYVGKPNYGITIQGDYMYTVGGLKIYKIDLRTNAVLYTYTAKVHVVSMCIYEDILYFKSTNTHIGKLNTSDLTPITGSLTWLNFGASNPVSMVADGTYLYIAFSNPSPTGRVVRVPLSYAGGTIGNTYDFITGLDYPGGLSIYGSHLYLRAPEGGNTIKKYNLSDGTSVSFSLTVPDGISLYSWSVFVHSSGIYIGGQTANNVLHGIVRADLDGTNVTYYYTNLEESSPGGSKYTNISGMAAYNNKLYCSSSDYGYVFPVDLPVTATYTPPPNINFVLSGLNSYLTLSTPGEIPNYQPTSLITDATITLDYTVSASDLQKTFFYRTDNPITTDASFVYYYVDTTKWSNQSTTLNPKNGIVTVGGYVANDPGSKDFLRDLARQLFGTYLAADLFTNEDAVVADIHAKFDIVASNVVALLTSTDRTSGSLIGMSTDEFGKKYLKDNTSTSNISRELFNQLITNAPARFVDISNNSFYNLAEDGFYKMPIISGDKISFKVTISPSTSQIVAVPTGLTSMTSRSYTVVLNVS